MLSEKQRSIHLKQAIDHANSCLEAIMRHWQHAPYERMAHTTLAELEKKLIAIKWKIATCDDEIFTAISAEIEARESISGNTQKNRKEVANEIISAD